MFGSSLRGLLRNALRPGSALLCPVCGRTAEFNGFTDNARESGRCSSCDSFNRQRQMAYAIRGCLGLPMQGALRFGVGFSIYNVESTGALHRALSPNAGYVCSEYFGPEHTPGQRIKGVRHEDLQHLSFEDRSFDLVLSSDVLEHVPEPYVAHGEILRVLKPGGRHIFTVPYNPGAERDDIRARIVDGRTEYLAEKLFHGDPVRPGQGILVWTIFGKEMLARLEDVGFAVRAQTLDEPRYGIVGDYAVVFEAAKPA